MFNVIFFFWIIFVKVEFHVDGQSFRKKIFWQPSLERLSALHEGWAPALVQFFCPYVLRVHTSLHTVSFVQDEKI